VRASFSPSSPRSTISVCLPRCHLACFPLDRLRQPDQPPRMPRLCAGTLSTLTSGFCDVCVRSSPADHERTNRATRKFLSSNGPDPDRRTAPPGALRYRFSFDPPQPLEKCTAGCFALTCLQTQQRRFALLGEGTEPLATPARSTDGCHRGRGRRKNGFGRECSDSLSFPFNNFLFSFATSLVGSGAAPG